VTADELTGRARSHVIDLGALGCVLHRDVVQPFLDLRDAARAADHDLVAVSSFRDFGRQRSIWNGKFRGGIASTPFCAGRRYQAPVVTTGVAISM